MHHFWRQWASRSGVPKAKIRPGTEAVFHLWQTWSHLVQCPDKQNKMTNQVAFGEPTYSLSLATASLFETKNKFEYLEVSEADEEEPGEGASAEAETLAQRGHKKAKHHSKRHVNHNNV